MQNKPKILTKFTETMVRISIN